MKDNGNVVGLEMFDMVKVFAAACRGSLQPQPFVPFQKNVYFYFTHSATNFNSAGKRD